MTENKKRQIYQALHSQSGWITRRDLAQLTGVKRLSSGDALYLDTLAEAGSVEIEKVRCIGAIGFEYRYRAIEGNEDTL